MSRFVVTLGAGTGPGTVTQCCVTTALLNNKPIATVGAIATHPNGSDVLIEGIPTILLNGQPIAFSTGKTAMGGCLLPNTSVKIVSPAPDNYVGFAPAPRVENRKEKEKEPEKSKEVKLKSDYAQQQLISIARSDGQAFFEARMLQIFGKDVAPKALGKLYSECKNGSIENPEIVVCKNPIHGLSAAYNNKTHKIYVSESFVLEAIDDNWRRNTLMAALVEEYGHHIDYLLRYVFDNNKKKDAEGDEGARFAYKHLYHISYTDFYASSSVPFAIAETPDGSVNLEWDFSILRQVLDAYTADRQKEDYDDHVGEDYEGFKVEDLSKKREKGWGHKNIQDEAIQETKEKVFLENSRFLYRGNWLRDYSQLIAPILVSNLGKLQANNMSDLLDKLKNGKIETYKDGSGKFNNIFAPKDTIALLEDLVRLLAIDEFYPKTSKLTDRKVINKNNFLQWRKIVDGDKDKGYVGLIPGFGELLGVSAPHDHFDNPFGLACYEDLHKNNPKFNGKISDKECQIGRKYGMKNYIRSDSEEGYGSKMVYRHLSKIFDEVKTPQTNTYQRAKNMVKLGGALHTVQDFYAHSNYAETYLVKMWFDKVFTWTDADRCRDYSQKMVKETYGISSVFDHNVKQITGVNKKAFFTPITTGTFDIEDMVASGLAMAKEKFFPLEPKVETTSRKITVGELTSNDLKILTLLRFYDKRSQVAGGETTWEERYYKFLDTRDALLQKYQKEHNILGKKVSLEDVADKLEKIGEWIDKHNPFNPLKVFIEETCRIFFNYFVHLLIKVTVVLITDAQMALKGNLEASLRALKIATRDSVTRSQRETLANDIKTSAKCSLWGEYPKNNNPSHTMLAKDEAKHPINSLAGDMAKESTVLLLRQLSKHWSLDKKAEANVTGYLSKIIAHPLSVNIFDETVQKWAKDNPYKVLRLCVSSYFFESLRIAIVSMDNAKKNIDKTTANIQIAINKITKAAGLGVEQDAVNKIGKNTEAIRKIFKDLVSAYKTSPYRELDGEVFEEWYKIYVDAGKFRPVSVSELNKLKQEWQNKVDKMLNDVVNNPISNSMKDVIGIGSQM